MEGATATWLRWNVMMTTMDGATATATTMAKARVMATATATAMDGTMVTAMEDATAMRQQRRQWMEPW